jgi:hypothetical protein
VTPSGTVRYAAVPTGREDDYAIYDLFSEAGVTSFSAQWAAIIVNPAA